MATLTKPAIPSPCRIHAQDSTRGGSGDFTERADREVLNPASSRRTRPARARSRRNCRPKSTGWPAPTSCCCSFLLVVLCPRPEGLDRPRLAYGVTRVRQDLGSRSFRGRRAMLSFTPSPEASTLPDGRNGDLERKRGALHAGTLCGYDVPAFRRACRRIHRRRLAAGAARRLLRTPAPHHHRPPLYFHGSADSPRLSAETDPTRHPRSAPGAGVIFGLPARTIEPSEC